MSEKIDIFHRDKFQFESKGTLVWLSSTRSNEVLITESSFLFFKTMTIDERLFQEENEKIATTLSWISLERTGFLFETTGMRSNEKNSTEIPFESSGNVYYFSNFELIPNLDVHPVKKWRFELIFQSQYLSLNAIFSFKFHSFFRFWERFSAQLEKRNWTFSCKIFFIFGTTCGAYIEIPCTLKY